MRCEMLDDRIEQREAQHRAYDEEHGLRGDVPGMPGLHRRTLRCRDCALSRRIFTTAPPDYYAKRPVCDKRMSQCINARTTRGFACIIAACWIEEFPCLHNDHFGCLLLGGLQQSLPPVASAARSQNNLRLPPTRSSFK